MGYRNKRAFDRTVDALRQVGRLEPVDEATVALGRTLAEALDVVDSEQFPAQVASLSRAHLATIRMLRGVAAGDDDGGISDWIAGLSAPMGDAQES